MFFPQQLRRLLWPGDVLPEPYRCLLSASRIVSLFYIFYGLVLKIFLIWPVHYDLEDQRQAGNTELKQCAAQLLLRKNLHWELKWILDIANISFFKLNYGPAKKGLAVGCWVSIIVTVAKGQGKGEQWLCGKCHFSIPQHITQADEKKKNWNTL